MNKDKLNNNYKNFDNNNNNNTFNPIDVLETDNNENEIEYKYNEGDSDNIENFDEIFKEKPTGKNIKIPDLNIKSISKFEEFLDNSIENIEINHDNNNCK
jgi:hypothetical protein